MRISSETLMDSSLRRLTSRLERFSAVQGQLASGKMIQKPSDDAGGMNRALMLRADQRLRDQEARNAEDGQTWTQLGDSKLQNSLDRVRRARDLIIQARSGASGQQDRQAIADELRAIQTELVSTANSRHLGRGLFAGFSGSDAVTKVAGVWTYTGDGGQVQRRISDSEVVTVNQTADQVFGFSLGPGNDLFTALDQVITDVTSGNDAGMAAGLVLLDRNADTVGTALGIFGARQATIETAIERNREESLAIKAYLSETEDTDFAKAVLELQTEEIAYKATLGAVSKAIQPSLMDFLR
jgi:flagellar hook-associated protein 3 FlgL